MTESPQWTVHSWQQEAIAMNRQLGIDNYQLSTGVLQ